MAEHQLISVQTPHWREWEKERLAKLAEEEAKLKDSPTKLYDEPINAEDLEEEHGLTIEESAELMFALLDARDEAKEIKPSPTPTPPETPSP